MSSVWHYYVIAGTVLSLVGCVWFLFANRKVSGEESTGHEWDGIRELDNPLPMWWIGMFLASIVFAGIYLVIYPGLGRFDGVIDWSSAQQVESEQARHDARFAPLYASLAAKSEAELHEDRQAQQVGRRLYLNNCATCHGVAARGNTGFPNLTDSEWQWGGSFEAVKTTLSNGRQANMAPWGAALGDDGIANVTQYVRSLSGGPHIQDMARAGESQYQTYCAACHGAEGKGNPALGAPNLANDIWLYGGTTSAITETLEQGRNGRMPAFGDVLSADQIHVLAAYVTSLEEAHAP